MLDSSLVALDLTALFIQGWLMFLNVQNIARTIVVIMTIIFLLRDFILFTENFETYAQLVLQHTQMDSNLNNKVMLVVCDVGNNHSNAHNAVMQHGILYSLVNSNTIHSAKLMSESTTTLTSDLKNDNIMQPYLK